MHVYARICMYNIRNTFISLHTVLIVPYTCIQCPQQGVSICKYLLGILKHTAQVKSIYSFIDVRYLHIHAFTCKYFHCTYAYGIYVCYTVCAVCFTYIHVLLRTYLHINHTVYAIIRENIQIYTVCQDH